MVWGHFLNRQVGALASSDVQCTITFGSHLFLARCQWSASNKDFIWNPLRRTLHNKDFSGIDVVMEASYSDDGSVVLIGMDAIWRGAVGAVCIRPSSLGHRPVPHTPVVPFFLHSLSSSFFSAVSLLLDTSIFLLPLRAGWNITRPLRPPMRSCGRSWRWRARCRRRFLYAW